jgi:beta-N-acetylhexosaminidase
MIMVFAFSFTSLIAIIIGFSPRIGEGDLQSTVRAKWQLNASSELLPKISPTQLDIATQMLTPTPIPTPTITYTPTPLPTSTPTPTPTLIPWALEQLTKMSLEQKIGQMIMVGVQGQDASNGGCQSITDMQPGGIVYVGSNTLNPQQTRLLSRELQNCMAAFSEIPLLVSIDHEGQYVHRFQSGATIFPPSAAIGATGNPDYAFLSSRAGGGELAFAGINTVLGPVADVLTNPDNFVIGERSFGSDPEMVSIFTSQAVGGYLSADIIPVLKHFPGHGSVAEDSHIQLPRDPSDINVLSKDHIPPFVAGIEAGAPIVMLSHVAFSSIDAESRPATYSPPVIEILREQLHFSGIIMTDSMSMRAITQSGLSVSEASALAVKAGVDMLLIVSSKHANETSNRLLLAVESGEIPEDQINNSVYRILAVKANHAITSFTPPDPPEPVWEENRKLSYEIGYHSVVMTNNEAGLVPIPATSNRIFIIAPVDGWGMDIILNNTLTHAGFTPYIRHYPGPWNGVINSPSAVNSLPVEAAAYDMVIFLTWQAHLNYIRYDDDWQIQLVNNLAALNKPVIYIALKAPNDVLHYPSNSSSLATFGTTQGQLQALADILIGQFTPEGKNPFRFSE